jgi:hypothetical protein
MNDYRVYLLDADGHIAKALVLRSPTSDEALHEVEATHQPAYGYEIWLGSQLVAERARGCKSFAPRSVARSGR